MSEGYLGNVREVSRMFLERVSKFLDEFQDVWKSLERLVPACKMEPQSGNIS